MSKDPLSPASVHLPPIGTHVTITTTTLGHRVGFRITTEAGWRGDFATRRDALAWCDRYGWAITSAVTPRMAA